MNNFGGLSDGVLEKSKLSKFIILLASFRNKSETIVAKDKVCFKY